MHDMHEKIEALLESNPFQELPDKSERMTAEDIADCIRARCAQFGLGVVVRALSAGGNQPAVVRILDATGKRELLSIYPAGVCGNDSPLLVRLRENVSTPGFLADGNFSNTIPSVRTLLAKAQHEIDRSSKRLDRVRVAATTVFALISLAVLLSVSGVLGKGCHSEEETHVSESDKSATDEPYDAWNEAYLRALK